MSDMQKTAPDKYKDTVCFLRHDGQGRTQNQREAVMEFVRSYRRSVVTQTKNGWIFLPELAFVAWHVYKEGLERSDAKILWKRAIEHEKVPKRMDSQGRMCVGVRKHMEINFLDNIESITDGSHSNGTALIATRSLRRLRGDPRAASSHHPGGKSDDAARGDARRFRGEARRFRDAVL